MSLSSRPAISALMHPIMLCPATMITLSTKEERVGVIRTLLWRAILRSPSCRSTTCWRGLCHACALIHTEITSPVLKPSHVCTLECVGEAVLHVVKHGGERIFHSRSILTPASWLSWCRRGERDVANIGTAGTCTMSRAVEGIVRVERMSRVHILTKWVRWFCAR